MTRVGFVGAGAVATRHAATLATVPEVEVVAVTDRDDARAAAFAAATGARVQPNHRALLAAGGLDAVYVCVPPFAHGAIEHDVIDAGLPLFVEKPLAAELHVAEGIAAHLDEKPVVTAVGYHWRYLDLVERAAALLEETPARLVSATWLDTTPPPAWWTLRSSSGGQTVEQATHVLDVVRVLAGEVVAVHGAGARTPRTAYPDADVDDVAAATLRFASGAVGTLTSTCLLPRAERSGVEFVCDGRYLALSETSLVVDDGGERQVHHAEGDARSRVDRDFVEAVRGGPDRIRSRYADVLPTHRLACAIAASAVAGRTVTLNRVVA